MSKSPLPGAAATGQGELWRFLNLRESLGPPSPLSQINPLFPPVAQPPPQLVQKSAHKSKTLPRLPRPVPLNIAVFHVCLLKFADSVTFTLTHSVAASEQCQFIHNSK